MMLPSDCSNFMVSEAPLSASSSGLRGNRQSCAVMVGSEEAKGLDMDMVAIPYERVEASLSTWLFGWLEPKQREHSVWWERKREQAAAQNGGSVGLVPARLVGETSIKE